MPKFDELWRTVFAKGRNSEVYEIIHLIDLMHLIDFFKSPMQSFKDICNF